MRLFMRGILGLLFLVGVGLCGLSFWPAGLAIWQGKILLDQAGLAALAAVLPVFLAGAATCAGAAVAIAQLDRADAQALVFGEPATKGPAAPTPRPPTPTASPAMSATGSSSAAGAAAPAASPAPSRRTGPNPLK